MYCSTVLTAAFVALSTTVYCTPIQPVFPLNGNPLLKPHKDLDLPHSPHQFLRCNNGQRKAIEVALRDANKMANEVHNLMSGTKDYWKKNKG